MTKSIIIHTENSEKLNLILDKIESTFDKKDLSLYLYSHNYIPWEDNQLKSKITTFNRFYAFPTSLRGSISIVELIMKSQADQLLIISEDLDPTVEIMLDKDNYDYFYCNKDEILNYNLDTKYKSIRWFIIDLLSQRNNCTIYFSDNSEDCERYNKKISHPLFREKIIYIDGGLGDHIMSLPLLEKIASNVYVSCKYDFVFSHLALKGFIYWDEELFGGYIRSVYEYGSANDSATIIDAFFNMYSYKRTKDDVLKYKGKREHSSEITTTKKIALICTSAAKVNGLDSNKDWKDIRWFKLVHELQKKEYYVIQVGSKSDNQIPNVDHKFLDQSLSNLAGLVEKAELWISVDTFFHHFAAAIKPESGICLTPFYNNHAKHPGVHYIEKDSGKDFSERRWWLDLQQPERKDCMDLIRLEDVLLAIDNYQ